MVENAALRLNRRPTLLPPGQFSALALSRARGYAGIHAKTGFLREHEASSPRWSTRTYSGLCELKGKLARGCR
jgi:hypothetical protein